LKAASYFVEVEGSESKQIGFFIGVFFCIAVGDPIIKRGKKGGIWDPIN
jgi:hypothetical protein